MAPSRTGTWQDSGPSIAIVRHQPTRPMVALGPGTTLARYRILERLGQGGRGTAYKAEVLRLRRPVVIKVLRPELASSEGARKRFEREACLLSLVDNPNVSA